LGAESLGKKQGVLGWGRGRKGGHDMGQGQGLGSRPTSNNEPTFLKELLNKTLVAWSSRGGKRNVSRANQLGRTKRPSTFLVLKKGTITIFLHLREKITVRGDKEPSLSKGRKLPWWVGNKGSVRRRMRPQGAARGRP